MAIGVKVGKQFPKAYVPYGEEASRMDVNQILKLSGDTLRRTNVKDKKALRQSFPMLRFKGSVKT